MFLTQTFIIITGHVHYKLSGKQNPFKDRTRKSNDENGEQQQY
jgi:hypothetical protein